MDHDLTAAKPLDADELTALGAYNAECARGLVHTPDWTARMEVLRERYHATREETILNAEERFQRDVERITRV